MKGCTFIGLDDKAELVYETRPIEYGMVRFASI